jgi:hypothetical protein
MKAYQHVATLQLSQESITALAFAPVRNNRLGSNLESYKSMQNLSKIAPKSKPGSSYLERRSITSASSTGENKLFTQPETPSQAKENKAGSSYSQRRSITSASSSGENKLFTEPETPSQAHKSKAGSSYLERRQKSISSSSGENKLFQQAVNITMKRKSGVSYQPPKLSKMGAASLNDLRDSHDVVKLPSIMKRVLSSCNTTRRMEGPRALHQPTMKQGSFVSALKKFHDIPGAPTIKFPAITNSAGLLQKFIEANELQMTSTQLMKAICDAFVPWFVDEEPRLIKLQRELPNISANELRRLIQEIDAGNVSKLITAQIISIENHIELWFYCGITTRNFSERLREHQRVHKKVEGIQILSTTSFEDAALAEYTGIDLLKMIAEGSVDNINIVGTWNESEGYDSTSMIKAAKTAKRFNIYLLWSKEPFEEIEKKIGTLSARAADDKRKKGSAWCLHSSRNYAPTTSVMVARMQKLSRINKKCPICQRDFVDAVAVEMHSRMEHETSARFTCEKCETEGKVQLPEMSFAQIRKHYKKEHSSS